MAKHSVANDTLDVTDKGVRATFDYLAKQQAKGWPGSVSIHGKPFKAPKNALTEKN